MILKRRIINYETADRYARDNGGIVKIDEDGLWMVSK
jgi:hypothetical protein